MAFALMPALAWGEGVAADAPGVSSGAMWQTVFGLLFILGLLFAAAWLLRKFNGGHAFGGNGPLKIVGGLVIGARERIVLVEVGDTWLIVGIAPGLIETLHTMPKGEVSATVAEAKPFGQWLKQFAEQKNDRH